MLGLVKWNDNGYFRHAFRLNIFTFFISTVVYILLNFIGIDIYHKERFIVFPMNIVCNVFILYCCDDMKGGFYG